MSEVRDEFWHYLAKVGQTEGDWTKPELRTSAAPTYEATAQTMGYLVKNI